MDRHSERTGGGRAALAMCVLGELDVTRAGEPIRLGSSQQRRLLAVLLVHANDVVSTDRLVDVLWGGRAGPDGTPAPETLVARLQTLVSRLRAALTDDRLETRPPGYRLRIAAGELDSLQFEELVRRALGAVDQPGLVVRTLDDALSLWRGTPYGEFSNDDFAAAEVARLAELHARAIEERSAALLELGRPAEVITPLESEIAVEPFRERLRALFMLALARSGRPVESLRAYEEFRRSLGEEVGVAPSPELQQLNDDIIRQNPDIAWSAAPTKKPEPDDLPVGTVTFLFTDIEGSTRLWEQHPVAMHDALRRHDDILRAAIEARGGHVVKSTGDGTHAVFAAAHAALSAAVDGQRALSDTGWGETGPLRVRMGLHTGEAEHRDGDYFGAAVNRAARVMNVGHGGQILMSHATERVVRDGLLPEFELVDLGEHRLRDLSMAEHIFQLATEGLPREFPRLRAVDAFTTNLPLQLSSFIGRDDDLHEIVQLLHTSRLVTLTGTGGVGKTRLSVQVAGELLPRFPDGVWLCELANANDADTLAQVIAATLGTAPRPGLSLEESIREFLSAKALLLVLDNCEQLLDEIARFTERLLQQCPEVRALATSRERLGITGEHVYALRSLALPTASTPLESIAASPAVQLFVERARAVRSDFSLEAANALAVADICRRLDGIPLAIELAAVRVVAMSPADIAAHLDERFRLLTGGRRTAAERHQTLRATVDWSYDMLEATERATFNRLGVFAGSFDSAAAAAVAAGEGIEGWDVLDALTTLVAKSLVIADEDARSGTHYQLLETLRFYALEHLDDGDRWRRRHAEHYAAFAEIACRGLIGPDEVEWRRGIRRDLDNLRAAVNWALERGSDDVVLATRIVAALARESYLDRSTGIGEWARRVLPYTAEMSTGLRSAVAAAAAQDALGRDDVEEARAIALEGVAAGFPGDCPTPGFAHLALAGAHAYLSEPHVGARLIHEALDALSSDANDVFTRTSLLARAAILDTWSFDGTARIEALEAVRLAREIGNPSLLAETLYALSWSELSDDPKAALEALDECIDLTRAGASDGVFGGALAQAARLRARFGDRRAALLLLRESIAHSYEIGYRRAATFALSSGVEVLLQCGATEGAAVISGWNPGRIELFGPERELRDALGLETYQRATARGADMTYDDVVAYALSHLDSLLEET